MVKIKPSDIGYSQDSISCVFTGRHYGKKIGETLDELVDGDISVDIIPTISVIFKNGKWFTCDNRRLWVLKHFELLGGCTEIFVTETNYIDYRKFTTHNGGTYVRVRGDPGGTWYYKYTRNPGQFKNYLLNRNITTFNKPYGSSRASISGVIKSNVKTSFPLKVQNDWRYDNQRTNTRQLQNTLKAAYGFQQQPLHRYHMDKYTDKKIAKSTSVTGKTIVNNSPSSQVSLVNSSRPIKQAPILTSSDSSVTNNYVVPNEITISIPTNRNDEPLSSLPILSIITQDDEPLTSLPILSIIKEDDAIEKNTDASISSPACTVESLVPEIKSTIVAETKHNKSCCIIL
ncbi:hypothetical protein ACJMK2_039115 [Sinanodonta woodiana]|uniref:Uncharacterized protein n=1 Tax=Sinanodonta woodiana TaxID=1069815 RepID=A0ABD3WBV9_SINWO